jgi:hypothetical protein
MIAALRRGLGRGPGLFPVPTAALRVAAGLAGRAEAFGRIAESLVANPDALRRFGWQPPVATPDGLAALSRASAATGA